MIFVGDDWAEAHHDVHVMNEAGERLTSRRLPEGLDGIGGFHELVAGHVDDPGEVVVGIETDRGLWVQALVAAGYQVYAINPVAVSRYRDRHTVSGAKSDAGDAKVLADLVRTDRHNHRPVAGDSDLAAGVKVLARGHQNLIWVRTRHTNMLRSALREYYPAALEAFNDLDHSDALAVLGRGPTPQAGRALTRTQIRAALRRGGRQRNLETRTEAIRTALRTDQLEAPAAVVEAFAAVTKAAVAVLGELNEQIKALETELADHFEQHPDADIIRSQPGLGDILGARVLGEFGDDPNRYATAKSRRNYAGTSPITRASGNKRASCWPGSSATSDWQTPSTNGPSAPSQPAQAAGPSTTNAEPKATSTTKRSAPSATASSASSTAASPTTPTTTKTPPGHTDKPPPTNKPLDNMHPWGV